MAKCEYLSVMKSSRQCWSLAILSGSKQGANTGWLRRTFRHSALESPTSSRVATACLLREDTETCTSSHWWEAGEMPQAFQSTVYITAQSCADLIKVDEAKLADA